MLRLEIGPNFILGRLKTSHVKNHSRSSMLRYQVVEKINQPKYIDTHIDFDSLPVVSKDEFFNRLEVITKKKLPGQFLSVIRNHKLFVFKQDYSSPVLHLTAILPLKEQIEKKLRTILDLDESDPNSFSIIDSNLENNFSYIMPVQILKILFAKAEVEEVGEELFSSFTKVCKNGKVREIIAPNETIKAPLKELNHLLQIIYDRRNSNIQIGYKKGKNIKSGAEAHVDHKFVYNLDIKDFFPSCTRDLVEKYVSFLFVSVPNAKYVKDEFYECILNNNTLFIGSPVSGTIANAIISAPITLLANMCAKCKMTLTVYADDITISSKKFITKDFAEKLFENAFYRYGLDSSFALNAKKSVGFSGCHRKITGVSINDSNKITINRRFFRDLRTRIAHLDAGDTNVNIPRLRGQLAFASMVDDSGKLYRYLKKFEATVQKYSLCSDEKMEELKTRADL